ncbi:MAG TPA: branched-chain amino acid ABC transporter permease/ATP-binding protein [Microthrixaceae bacterium]|nr:branched-chain amino acid ABC transporter permease/ATP-binding protein [Microthrixaceae bacterium]
MTLATAFFSEATLRFVLLGMATGSLTALVALGIVLVHRTSGVLNFSAGAFGGIAAFVWYDLREAGMPSLAATAIGLIVGVLLGLVTYLVMASLRNASQLAKLIATLGLFSAAQAFMILQWGLGIVQPKPMLPSRIVTLWGDLTIGLDRLLLIGIALGCAAVLRLVYSRTLFGLATSAVAENRRVAASGGWSPNRIEQVNFAVAGALSALAAILLAPIVTLNAAVLAVAVIPALAAALVGRFSSFGITVVAALAIGVIQAEIALFQPDIAEWWGVSNSSLTGLAQAVPLVIILGYLVVTGRSRLQRGESLARLPLPGSGRVSTLPLALGIAVSVTMLIGVESWADALITTFALAIIVASVVVIAGYAGQLSLCQFALAGVGAWMAARLISANGWPFEVALVAAIAGTTILGIVVALPAIRTRGTSLAVATLALALMINALLFTNTAVTGGLRGLPIDRVSLFGLDLDPVEHPERYGGFVLVVLVLIGLMVANLRRGRVGSRMLAVRSNERAAASLGISVVGVKLYAFAVAAGIAAIGGVLFSLRQSNVGFAGYNIVGSVLLVQYAVIGGIAWVSGIVSALGAPGTVGARVFTELVPEGTNVFAWLGVFSGLSAVLVLRRSPDGIAALNSMQVGRFTERFKLPRSRDISPAESSGRRREPARLEVVDITVKFGGVLALDGVGFAVEPGEVVGLIGPNGAGKTTLLDVVTGFTTQSTGSVRFGGQVIDGWSVERRARAGLVRSWQAVELFEEMTVRDNLLVAADDQARRYYLRDLVHPGQRRATILMNELVEEFGLEEVLDERPSTLPHGVARLVGIARALVTEPSVLMLDEPAAGLSDREGVELGAAIRSVAAGRGIGILVVEHDVPLLLQTCDRIVALDFGRQIAEGTPAEIARDEAVIDAYLGSAAVATTGTAPIREVST